MAGAAARARRITCPSPREARTCGARSSSGAADVGLLDPPEAATSFTDAATDLKGTSVPKAIFRIQDYAIRVANSNDVVANHRGTLVFCYLTAKCGSQGEVGGGGMEARDP